VLNEGWKMKDNLILQKSYVFSLKIIEMYKFLCEDKKEYVLSKQLLRAGTSIGANVNEAQAGMSRKDFVAKMSIASKEARETRYWLELLADSGYISKTDNKIKNLFEEMESIISILTKIVKTGASNGK
jgi:four helix bundle protein